MVGFAVGWLGIFAIFIRIVLLDITGPVNLSWLHDTFRFEWWALQPALWATAVQQTRQLRKKTGEMQIKNVNLTKANATLRRCSILSSSVAAGAVFCGVRRTRPCIRHHVSQELTAHCVRQTVTIECPGVVRSGITIRVMPGINGAEVEIKRSGAVGLTAAFWRRRFTFPWKEGVFQCRQDQMQLENGVLRLVFESKLKLEQHVLHLPPRQSPQVFSLAGARLPRTMLTSCDGRSREESSSCASLSQPEDESSPTASKSFKGQFATTVSGCFIGCESTCGERLRD